MTVSTRSFAARCLLASALLLATSGTSFAVDERPLGLTADYLRRTAEDLLLPREDVRERSEIVTSEPTREERPSGRDPEGKPPEGASSHEDGIEAQGVDDKAGPVRWQERKPVPDSSDSRLPEPRDWTQISFASGSFTPARGIDALIRELVEAAGESDRPRSTYAFVLTEEVPSEAMEEELRALGATVLGLHDSALKVKVPLRTELLEALAELPYVHYVGPSLPEQKVDTALREAIERFGDEVNLFPVIITLFEGDRDGVMAASLERLGVRVAPSVP